MATDRPYDDRLADSTGDPWWRDALSHHLAGSMPRGHRLDASLDTPPPELPLLEGPIPLELLLYFLHRCVIELHRQGQELQPWLEFYANQHPDLLRNTRFREHFSRLHAVASTFPVTEQMLVEIGTRVESAVAQMERASEDWERIREELPS